jgi:acyl-coenzyme A synthetase/AMP-(fatty) acid ligase
VLLVLADSPYAVAAFFGAIRAGLVPVLLDPASSSEAIRFAAIDSEALTAIVDASVLTRITGASLTGTRLSALIVVDGEPSGREPIPAIPVFAWLGELPSDSTAAATDRDEMAFWLYTPSDAGRPKAVVHLQHDLAYAAACHARAMLGLGASDRCLSYSPMHTATGLCASLAFPFSAGASSICRAVLGATAAGPVLEPLAAVLAFRPTVLFGVPEFYADVLARSSAGVSALQGIRACLSTASLGGANWRNVWEQRFGQKIIDGLAMPETLCAFISATPDMHKPGTLGRRVPGFELILTNAAGQRVGDGEPGMLWVRGHSSAPCYWNRPSETAETMVGDGWLFTGHHLIRDIYGFYSQVGE